MVNFLNLEGKKCLVTGGTSGIGNAIVQKMLEHKAIVCASGTNETKLEELQGMGCKGAIRCDLADESQSSTLVKQACELMDGLDVLVCNAGITRDALAIRMKMSNWDEVLNINLRASFILNQQACKIMMGSNRGRIVNISSVVGSIGNAGQVNYAAAKAGLEAMSRTLAKEFAKRGITVNCVAPGFIQTPMTDVLSDKAKEGIFEMIPMMKMGTPEEVANLVLFLSSDISSYITGQVIHINGGLFMLS